MAFDYRAASYKARAASISRGELTPSERKRGIKKSSSTIPESDISISPEYVVSDTGGVAIKGGAQPDKYVYTAVPTTLTPQPETTSTTTQTIAQPSVSPAAQLAFASPEAAKATQEGRVTFQTTAQTLAGQSIREDKPQTIATIRSKRDVIEPKKTFIQKADVALFGEGGLKGKIKYIFTPQPLPGQETTQEQVAGREFFATGLVTLGTGAIAKPVDIGKTNLKLGSQQTVQQVISEEEILTTGKINARGVAQKSVLGFNVGKPQQVKVSGVVSERARPIDTEIFGLESADNVYGTKGSIKLDVSVGKKTLKSSSEYSGFEVGGSGKRQVTQVVGRGEAETFPETFYTTTSGDVTKGGIVSPKGSSVFVSKDVAETSLVKPGGNVYFNPETGLESATPTLRFKPDELVNIKYSRVSSAASSEVPFTAEYTYESAGSVIGKGFKRFNEVSSDVGSAGVSGASQMQISEQAVTGVRGAGLVDVKQVVAGIVDEPAVRVRVPGVGVSNVVSESKLSEPVKSSEVVSVVSLKQDTLQGVKSDVFVKGVSESKPVVALGATQFGGLRSLSRSKSVVESEPAVAVSSLPKSEVLSRVSPQVSVVSKQGVVQRVGLVSVQGLGRPVGVPSVVSPVVVGVRVPVGGVFKPGGVGGVFGVEVRRGGVFRSVGGGLSLQEAIKLGSSRVRSSAAATFRVTRQGTPIRISEPLGASFYQKGTSIIQKPKARISSPGELSEITFKGIRTIRRGKQ